MLKKLLKLIISGSKNGQGRDGGKSGCSVLEYLH